MLVNMTIEANWMGEKRSAYIAYIGQETCINLILTSILRVKYH